MRTQILKTTFFAVVALLLLTLSVQAQSNVPEKPTDISPLLIGEVIPTVNIPDANGKSFDLNVRVAEKPTILIFYRGGWCPFCNKELAGLQSIQADLVKMGYQIIAISTDSPENLTKIYRQTPTELYSFIRQRPGHIQTIWHRF